MLKAITIENFRCFESIHVDGFRRVNLIGGKNNAGKTALLEALLLYFYPNPSAVIALKQARKESASSAKSMPKMAWNTFFYDQNTDQEVQIKGFEQDEKSREISLSVTFSLDSKTFEDDEEKFIKFIRKDSSVISILQIQLTLNESQVERRSIVASSREFLSIDFVDENIPLIPTFLGFSNEEIASQYDKVNFENRSEQVLKILRILDESIEDAETF